MQLIHAKIIILWTSCTCLSDLQGCKGRAKGINKAGRGQWPGRSTVNIISVGVGVGVAAHTVCTNGHSLLDCCKRNWWQDAVVNKKIRCSPISDEKMGLISLSLAMRTAEKSFSFMGSIYNGRTQSTRVKTIYFRITDMSKIRMGGSVGSVVPNGLCPGFARLVVRRPPVTRGL